MSAADTPKCQARVNGGGLSFIRTHQCSNNGKMQHDGKWYCAVHNPVRKAERDRKSMEKFEAEAKRRMQAHLDACHHIQCHEPMLKALMRLSAAALARDTIMGDACSMLAAQAELRDANKQASAAIQQALNRPQA